MSPSGTFTHNDKIIRMPGGYWVERQKEKAGEPKKPSSSGQPRTTQDNPRQPKWREAEEIVEEVEGIVEEVEGIVEEVEGIVEEVEGIVEEVPAGSLSVPAGFDTGGRWRALAGAGCF
ncbi:hypothetical protein VC83_08505 [Pseudogymnoascus destructans]|uniref:Uncharacterized protein n=1 Tax=Pseudogymnoascus destructans TaxID=655981 RepID=A0A176ZZ45_9PEZI|nr:uncharacterized protein VC83_08505 [Pseudogymnoascus destructans]OAF55158.1 hypothetical protein VC83_08505 [Pseudogymnoascus destructans]